MIRSILVPLDGSTFAEQALPHATALATRWEATLHLAVVHRFPAANFPADAGGVWLDQLDREARGEERLYLARERRALAAAHRLPIVETLLEGDPADALARYTRDESIDLVVMPRTGAAACAASGSGASPTGC